MSIRAVIRITKHTLRRFVNLVEMFCIAGMSDEPVKGSDVYEQNCIKMGAASAAFSSPIEIRLRTRDGETAPTRNGVA